MSNSPDQAVSDSQDHDIHALLRKHGPASFDYDHPDNRQLADFLAQTLCREASENAFAIFELSSDSVIEEPRSKPQVFSGGAIASHSEGLLALLRSAMKELHACSGLLDDNAYQSSDTDPSGAKNLIVEMIESRGEAHERLKDKIQTIEEQFVVLNILDRDLRNTAPPGGGPVSAGRAACDHAPRQGA